MDVAITYSESSIAKVEEKFISWHEDHMPVPTSLASKAFSNQKRVSSLFHLKKPSGFENPLKFTLGPTTQFWNCERYPTYLGITLDRSLTYKKTICTNWNKKVSFPSGHWWEKTVGKLTGVPHLTLCDLHYSTCILHQLSIVPLSGAKAPTQKNARRTFEWSNADRPLAASAPPLWIFYHHSREYSHQAVPGKNSVKRLYYKADNTDHLLHNTLYSKNPSQKKPLRPFLESLQGYDPQQEPIPHKTANHTSKTGQNKTPRTLPSHEKAWVQLNRLRNRNKKNLLTQWWKWGFGNDNLCQCGETPKLHTTLSMTANQ